MNLQLLSEVAGKCWAMDKPRVERLLSAMRAGGQASEMKAAPMSTIQRAGNIAVIPIYGMIWPTASVFSWLFGGTTVLGLRDALRQSLADPTVAAIVLKIDSPGGCADMIGSMADEIFAASQGDKPIVAYTETMAASAAYWLGSQAQQFVMARDAYVGSIGVYMEHTDVSKALDEQGVKVTLISAGEHKVDGNPYEPLADAVRAQMQAGVDEVNADFVNAVARGRRVTKAVVNDTFGQGLVFRGPVAKTLGMADRVSSFDDLLGRLGGRRRGIAAEDMTPAILAEADVPVLSAGLVAKKADDVLPDSVDPLDDGTCPDGYSIGEDGVCYLDVVEDETAKATALLVAAEAEAEHAAVVDDLDMALAIARLR